MNLITRKQHTSSSWQHSAKQQPVLENAGVPTEATPPIKGAKETCLHLHTARGPGLAPAPGESSCEGCGLQIKHCTEFADLDNCNLVVPETVLKRSTLVYSGAKGLLSAIHLQIDQKKCVCIYVANVNNDLGEGEGCREYLCTILQLLSKFKVVSKLKVTPKRDARPAGGGRCPHDPRREGGLCKGGRGSSGGARGTRRAAGTQVRSRPSEVRFEVRGGKQQGSGLRPAGCGTAERLEAEKEPRSRPGPREGGHSSACRHRSLGPSSHARGASSTTPGCCIRQVLPLRVGLSEGFRMRPSRAAAGTGEET